MGGSTGNKPAFNIGGAPSSSQPAQSQDAAKPAGSALFSLGSSTGNKPSSPFTLGGASSGQPTSGTPAASSPFTLGGGGSQPASSASAAATTSTASDKPSIFSPGATAPATGGLFGGGAKDSNKETSSAGAAAPQTPATSGGFSMFNKPTETPASTGASQATPAAPTPAASSAFKLGGTVPAQSSGTSQSSTTATAAPTFSLGSTTGQPSSTSTTQAATTTTSAAASTPAPAAAGNANLGASTIGQPPSAQSRLKNKSMDEIITRWATDLSKYQKSFQGQAKQVAEWDRMLVENSDKISKLYSKTFQARKDTEEVERQLTAVENDQAELSRWLDNYEKEVDDLMDKMVGGQDGLQGPDQERERTYKLAEKLSDRLNDLNKDLSDMIEEINSVSATLSKTDKPDDPLSQVVRVLNNHLSQLQAIDSGAAELHEKVTKAQKEAQSYRVNGQALLGNDAADDFYRSFMGRR
ncbi:Nucleoporin Nsp1-like protein [Lasiodiplodia theobromae]|nr:Nucleoporin Nsp1-like protein [Lasiodiplodia theobromae]